ncbi:P-loop containing nucleoside triphosphate hydrolase protein [Sistotremastrum niveocremeum HHB9708]|uniref:p-loop containing nucleoside triphosphate hydrolase protein n=1 Tax=Sistotremastrum niveocremeum HHB9708 TaxID=1314777 RepID=A0A164YKF2_9AGAM|nr:P-loop containing nucleoside triphosphate hydrolase protein [Sistotremastrum niveocremeum HHB9708]
MNRKANLSRHLKDILGGQKPLDETTGPLFLEAICDQSDLLTCLKTIRGNANGLSLVQQAMRMDISTPFLNGIAATFIFHLSSKPEVAKVADGMYIRDLLLAIVEPDIYWAQLIEEFKAGRLQERAQQGFAWLLLQLVSLRDAERAAPYRQLAQDPKILNTLVTSRHSQIRARGALIQHLVTLTKPGSFKGLQYTPGGRHDNDFENFRKIAILPTSDELESTEKPFLRPASTLADVSSELLLTTHLDNQFRLLREDMIYEMRDELQIAQGKKAGKHRGRVLKPLYVHGMYTQRQVQWPGQGQGRGQEERLVKWGLMLECRAALGPQDQTVQVRKKFFLENKNILRHQSMACLMDGNDVLAFATIHRDEDLLSKKQSIIVIQIQGSQVTRPLLQRLKSPKELKLFQVDTALFAYEPVLNALQSMQRFCLSEDLFDWNVTRNVGIVSGPLSERAERVQHQVGQDLRAMLETQRTVCLDAAQTASLCAGLSQRVSLIQGPPGTGKSFIGALLAKSIHDLTQQTILVVCYTNHALDQFLEDLLDIGIPMTSLVRLGGKSTPRTLPFSIQTLSRTSSPRRTKSDWDVINVFRERAKELSEELHQTFREYQSSNASDLDILEHLEFQHSEYHAAFKVPDPTDDMQVVGHKGKAVKPNYLLKRWASGKDAGLFKAAINVQSASQIWNSTRAFRDDLLDTWRAEMLEEQIGQFSTSSVQYNSYCSCLESLFNTQLGALLSQKRIIGCTTTAAAKYREDIESASPSVVLVEEAGEILESHVLTALGADVNQLILIGDHKQLRPKAANYLLTVEKGDGYDLNRSLFERLVISGYPHTTLRQQHRMRPEISCLVRELTYPELMDGPNTHNRPDIRGLRNNVVFISHERAEEEMKGTEERDTTTSKRNMFEAQMVWKIVRYLAQQGYGTEDIVVLTPYLGQLRLLQDTLAKEHDTILSDLDTHDLVRAGLMDPAAAKEIRKPLRLSTIDNYQGEESDIVVVSLTRSNANCDIGFMIAPERLNVLLSRARNGLIMIGNSSTFRGSRKGGELWSRFFSLMSKNGHMYSGLPAKCERHPARTTDLMSPADFEEKCPDGGCSEPCGAHLPCNHDCPLRCHQLSDHTKFPCERICNSNCANGHSMQWKCSKGPSLQCKRCIREAKLAEEKKKREFELQEKRDAARQEHLRAMAELDSQLAGVAESLKDQQLTVEMQRALESKRQELLRAKERAASRPLATEPVHPPSGSTCATDPSTRDAPANIDTRSSSPSLEPSAETKQDAAPLESAARLDWQRQKDIDGAINPAIDSVMDMTGLEDVKQQILRIKAKVDTAKRQGTDLKGERFNVSMLGNPGTGKTTVARHYARFLASMDVIPGHVFVETTGSSLANDAVPGVKKSLENIKNAGGGVMFIDEAYQLVSETNVSGKQVLDFLLAEMENLVGIVAFIFAGYNKEMEKFFEHNPGLQSRVPYTLQFQDYTDDELLDMLRKRIEKKYNGLMKLEGGHGGLYTRIAVRRLGRGRGCPGFGNARALENLLAKIGERQAERLSKLRRTGSAPDDFTLTKEDLIGPRPADVRKDSKDRKALQSLIGLTQVKQSVEELFAMTDTNYLRELKEIEPFAIPLNRVFIGSPGTGKTTVAKHYGQILTDLGLLSNGEVVIKNPSDFIGAYIGHSESQTKAILAATRGKVLIIDEAYMLYSGTGGGGNTESFKTAVIDTIVAEVQSVPGEDRCVLLLGYKKEIENMFQHVNPGLARRFAIENAFQFQDYTDEELAKVLDWKLGVQDLTATDKAKQAALEVLSRKRNRPNFGNIGEVENLLSEAKSRYQGRQALLPLAQRSPDAPFEPLDFDPDFNRGDRAGDNLVKLFEDVVGGDEIVQKLREWQQVSENMKAVGQDPRKVVPTAFIFKGPPGTGKTTTARKMGQVYSDMGFLSSSEVVECSATELVGQYVGHTGPKTRNVFTKALGRVLFIDEAYRLAEGHFAKEAIDEVVSIMTEETFRGKLIVILAGYDKDMNDLLSVNPGLSSRFPEEIYFKNFSPENCLKILALNLQKQRIRLEALNSPSSPEHATILDHLRQLSELPEWGNARDMETLSKKMITAAFSDSSATRYQDENGATTGILLPFHKGLVCIQEMLSSRSERAKNTTSRNIQRGLNSRVLQDPTQRQLEPPALNSAPPKVQTSRPSKPAHQVAESKDSSDVSISDGRDDGVTDEVWNRLKQDKIAEERAREKAQEELERLNAEVETAKQNEKEIAKKRKQLEGAQGQHDELLRLREEERLRSLALRTAEAKRVAALEAEERKKREEARVQSKIRRMGVCVAGFQWIKQADGYRCAGGGHFLTNAQLGL